MRYMLRAIMCILLCAFTISVSAQSKLSSYIKQALAKEASALSTRSTQTNTTKLMTALVRCHDDYDLRKNECKILASFDNNIYIASIPLNKMNDLVACKSVERIEAGTPCNVSNDVAASVLKVNEAWNHDGTDSGYTGKGVIVGVMDIGFDLTHPTFYSSDGSTYRIRRFWDMLEPDSTLYVGREYKTEEELLTKAHAVDGLAQTHGTHTTGTAAGSGYNGNGRSKYTGMAPDADIVMVANYTGADKIFVKPEDSYKFTFATDLLGFKYIFDYADEVGKPCVINFSEGAKQDFYEQNLFDEVLEQMTGPGRIIVSSAGNESLKRTYLKRKPDTKEAKSLYKNTSSNTAGLIFTSKDEVNIKVTIDALSNEPYECTLSDKDMLLDSIYTDTITVKDNQYVINKIIYNNCYDKSLLAGELYVTNIGHSTIGNKEQKLCLTLTGNEELYYYMGEFYDSEALHTDAETSHNIHYPSASRHVISVGANGYRESIINYLGDTKENGGFNHGERSNYSSIGPTIEGVTKPDIIAPGTNVISAYSSYYLENNPNANDIKWDVEHFEFNNRTYVWNTDTGTSMSSPVVAGIIALWLEACPTLTSDQILSTFAATANKYSTNNIEKDNFYGYGEIDASEGLKYIIENFVTSIDDIVVENDTHNSRNGIFNMMGQKLTSPSKGINIINGKKVLVK